MSSLLAEFSLAERTKAYWSASRVLHDQYADPELRRRASRVLDLLARSESANRLRGAAAAVAANLAPAEESEDGSRGWVHRTSSAGTLTGVVMCLVSVVPQTPLSVSP